MPRGTRDDTPAPLPQGWLPRATPPEGGPDEEAMVARVMAAAEPGLRRLGKARPREALWPAVLGSWWRPAAALAAVAAALLLLSDAVPGGRRPDAGAVPLSLLAAQGDPGAFLEQLGIEADPVLALIALREEAP